jgi:hypothetical protein
MSEYDAHEYQFCLERLGEAMDVARRRPPLQQEAHDTLVEIARMVVAGKQAIGVPRVQLVGRGALGRLQ